MGRKTLWNLVIGLALVFVFGAPNYSVAFKAPDRGLAKDYGRVNIGLKSILVRNLNRKVTGNAAEAAPAIAEGFIKAGFKAQLRKIQVDDLGYQHIRIDQTFRGLPVVGGEVIVHINNKGIMYQMNGKYLPDIRVSVEPSIDAAAALKVGLDEKDGKPGLHVSKEPSLVIYGKYLAYHYVLSHEGGEGVEVGQWWYYVDAHTGKLIYRYNNIKFGTPIEGNGSHTAVSGNRLTGEDGSAVSMTGFYESSGSHNYFLYNFNNLWGIYNEDDLDWEQQASSNWGTSDPAAISCGKNYADTQTYVSAVLGRNSFDNAGAFARANVHTGTNYVNAYWDGTDFHFGDGDGVMANALTVLDVAGHEFGHALTQYTSDLIYSYESGALNEAYSDIIGCSVEFYTQDDGTGSYPNATPGHDDWLIGEDCWLSDVALRDIKNPQRFELPSYYLGTYWYTGTGDYGGVHTNNGVACFAYYLLAVGGSGANDGHPYGPITGIGEVNAAAVALRANYYYHVSSDVYADAREHWISAAADLGHPTATVEDVWTACGVGDEPPPDDDVYEPDNTPAAAQRLSGSLVTQDHTIDPDGDVDWFVISMTNGTEGRAETSNLGGSNADTVLEIYDRDCNMVALNDDGGTGLASLVEWTAAYTGDYYIKARTFGGSYPHCDDQGGGPAFCSYTINIQWVACDGEDPDIDVDPQSIDITMPCNASQNRTLEIANVGGADLVVSNICDEETLLTVAPKLDRSPVKGQGFSRFSDALKALGLPSNKEAQGDVIRQCASSVPTVVLMGHHYVSSQGVLYVVSEDGTGTIYKMDENCNAVSTLPGPTGEMNGVTFDGQYLWVSDYYGQDAESDWLYKLNASTGAVIGSWDLRPQGFDGILGLAWDGQYLWAASIWNSTIFKLDTQGNVLGSFSVAWAATGMDWDGQYLLCTDNESATIRRLTSTGTVIDSMPGGTSSGTFGVTCGTDGLWVSSFANDTLYLLECDWCGDVPPPCACSSDAPWMSVNPTSGTVQPGGHMNVTVSFNTTGMSPGDYYGNIKIASNDPDEGCVVVPVTLHVTSCNGHPCVEDDTGALDIQGSNGPPGGTVSIPVRIQNAPNAVSALGFDVTYPSVLEYKGFTEGPCVAGWTIFDVTPQGPGLVRVGGLTTGNGISAGQSCIVVYLNFDIDPECDSFYELDLQDLKDDISGWSISHGCFDCTGCDCDINDDDDITPGDALCAFQKYMGICPTDCGPCDEICCDVNADGECTPADALEIFREYMGEDSVCSSPLQ